MIPICFLNRFYIFLQFYTTNIIMHITNDCRVRYVYVFLVQEYLQKCHVWNYMKIPEFLARTSDLGKRTARFFRYMYI